MSFRSLIADLLLGGNLANAYTLTGTITSGTVGGLSVVVDGARDAIFYYDSTGALVLSLASKAGTDPHANAYPVGLALFAGGVLVGAWEGQFWTIGPSGGNQLQAQAAGAPGLGQSVLNMISGSPDIDLPTQVAVSSNGVAGSTAYDEFDLTGPRNATVVDQWFFQIRSASKDGSQRGQTRLGVNQGGTIVNAILADLAGAHVLGDVTAVHPGTGTGTVAAVAETWQAPVLTANFRSDTISHPFRYRKQGLGPNGAVLLDGGVQANGAGPWPRGTVIANLPIGYRPSTGTRVYVGRSDVLPSAGTGTVKVLNTGDVQLDVALTANTQQVYFEGMWFPLD